MTDAAITLTVKQGREWQARQLAKRRKDLEEEEAHLAELQARDDPPAPPSPKPECWICHEPVQSGRNMGVIGLITGATVLAHAQTGQTGGCWTIMQRARQTILPKCKTGPKKHDKNLGDRLLRAEIDRMMTMPKYQAEVAKQWENSYHLTAKTGLAIRVDRIEQELKDYQLRQYGAENRDSGRLTPYQQEHDLAVVTKIVDEREAARYADPDIEFSDDPAHKDEHYPGEHGGEVE